MRLERYQSRPRQSFLVCGCVLMMGAICVLGALLILPGLLLLVIQIVDFNRVKVVGADLGGQLFSIPTDLRDRVTEVESTINDILGQAVLSADGRVYQIQDNNQLVLILR